MRLKQRNRILKRESCAGPDRWVAGPKRVTEQHDIAERPIAIGDDRVTEPRAAIREQGMTTKVFAPAGVL